MQSVDGFEQAHSAHHQKMKARLFIALCALALLFGVMAGVLRGAGATGWLTSDIVWWVSASVLLALWAVHDHGHRGAGELDWDQMLFVFWPLTLLLWLVRTRHHQGVVRYLGFCALVILPSAIPWFIFR